MSVSVVEICNLALLNYGDITITSLEDATKQARTCKVFYPIMRDQLLYDHPWNFAMTRADISAQVATAPAFGFDYAYTLPSDCLRVWELSGSSAEWAVESGQLLTDQAEDIHIRYIKQVTETGRFNPAFVNCLGLFLGAKLAAKIADNSKVKAELLEELRKIALPSAHLLNAIEGNRPRHKDEQGMDSGNYSWQTQGR